MKPWSTADIAASEILVGLEKYRNKGTLSQLLSPLRPFAPGYFPLVFRLVQSRPPDHFSAWSLFQHKTLGILFLYAFFPLCLKRPKHQTTRLLRETKVFRSVKMLQDVAHACSFSLAHFTAYKHILLLSKKNVYQKWHLSSSLTVSQVPAWWRRGKGRQVHLLTCSVRMWRSRAVSAIATEELQNRWDCEHKWFGKAGNRRKRRLWSVWLCCGYLRPCDKDSRNNRVRKTAQLYL